jgi:hypothetical protein
MNFVFASFFQIVHPAYETMLEHVRSKCLEAFKIKLDGSLKSGKGFDSSVKYLTPSIMCEFDEASKGNNQYILLQFVYTSCHVAIPNLLYYFYFYTLFIHFLCNVLYKIYYSILKQNL